MSSERKMYINTGDKIICRYCKKDLFPDNPIGNMLRCCSGATKQYNEHKK